MQTYRAMSANVTMHQEVRGALRYSVYSFMFLVMKSQRFLQLTCEY